MKHLFNRWGAVGAILSLLLLSAVVLAACQGTVQSPAADSGDGVTNENSGGNGTDIGAPSDTGEASSDTAGTPSETGDLSEEVTLGEPESGVVNAPDEPLIGDGVESAGVYAAFSLSGGVYTDTEFSIRLTVPSGYTVRYTTDGSMPDSTSQRYRRSIDFTQSVGEATVIRAACFNSEKEQEGQVITQTYVTVKDTASLAYTVMISTDEENLQEMYADVQEKIEHPAHVEIVAPDGTRVVSQDAGLRLFGGSSRGLAQKSFKIVARKDGYFGTDTPYVGAGTFTYPFFPERVVQAGLNAGRVLEKYDGLVLRNGGNDSLLHTDVDPMDPCLLRDGIANEFVQRYAPNVGASLSQFAVVYLNGEYYGLLELRENQNEDYIKRIWGVSDDDVVVIKSELDTSRQCGRADCQGNACRFCGVWFYYETDDTAAAQKELDDWIALCQKAADAVGANETTYRKIYAELESKIDLRNVMEYVAISCYLCNKDWPYNNVRLWRYTGDPVEGVAITDGRFRFATRDMDMTFGRYSSPEVLPDLDSRDEVDMFAWVFGNYVGTYGEQAYPDALYLQGLFSFLLRDDTFRAEFAAYCRTLASDEATAYLTTLYTEAYNQVKPLVNSHIQRWSSSIEAGYTLRTWQAAAGRVQSFIQTRPAIFLRQLEQLLSMYE